jgi:hypothetical protein
MTFLTRIAVGLALVLALVAPALALGIPAEQKGALTERVESFEAAILAGDVVALLDAMPRRVLDKTAANSGLTTEWLIANSQQLAAEAFKSMRFVSCTMDIESAEFVALADGNGYALIPTETVVEILRDEAVAGKFSAQAWTLGLFDGGTWYLMSVDEAAQAGAVRDVYPALADVEFPAATGGPVTE